MRRYLLRVILTTVALLSLVAVGYTGARHEFARRASVERLQRATRDLVTRMLDDGKTNPEIRLRVEALQAGLDVEGKTLEEIRGIIEAMRREHEQ